MSSSNNNNNNGTSFATAVNSTGMVTDTSKDEKAPPSAAAAAASSSSGSSSSSSASGAAAAVAGLDSGKDDPRPLKLVSKDKMEFTLEKGHARMSKLVRTALENDDKEDTIPLMGTHGRILEMVVQYLKEHKGVEPAAIEKPLRSKEMKDVCPHKQDATFIDKIGDTRQDLYDLVLAANYMDIQPLLHLGCAKIASLIKGQPLEKFAEILDPKRQANNSNNGSNSNSSAAATVSTSTTAATASAASSSAAAPTNSDKKDQKKNK